jgi:phosphoribosylanthranilate isomerase
VSLWIKVCGLTSEAGIEAALAARVDAVGFVFAPSKRRVSAQQAAKISLRVPSSVARIAVMLHPSQSELDEVCAVFDPDMLQTDIDDLSTLRVPAALPVLPVVRRIDALLRTPARLLFEGPMSGTGKQSNWQEAAVLARRTELILAGGLNADNVAAAIASVRPFGVDVSSGVEREPGIKDPAKIAKFVAAARAAVDELADRPSSAAAQQEGGDRNENR